MSMENKAYLINPFHQTIMIVDYEYGGSFKQISQHISTEEVTDPLFCAVDIDGEHTLYLDDEGLYREDQHFFNWKGYPQPLAGKGLIMGTDYETGESVAPTLTLDEVSSQITFPFTRTVVEPNFNVLTFDSAEEFQDYLKNMEA